VIFWLKETSHSSQSRQRPNNKPKSRLKRSAQPASLDPGLMVISLVEKCLAKKSNVEEITNAGTA
jgi:hypothetical protein